MNSMQRIERKKSNLYLLHEQVPAEAVRWFYGRGTLHSNTWKPFRGADSINIEIAYRKLLASSSDVETQKVIVRNHLFEADVYMKMCSPVYWTGQKRSQQPAKMDWCDTPMERGVWFNKTNWMPLDSSIADQIEREHITVVIDKIKQITSGTWKKKVIHTLELDNYKITWMINGDVFLVTRKARPFSHVKLHGDLSSLPIQRGYHTLASAHDRALDITHICFVVHGIGQQLASIRHECSKLRSICNKVIKKYYPKLSESGQRLEFIPVDWRSALNLNCATIENVTVGQMRPLRMYINNCFIDVLYYTYPLYRSQIMASLSWELIRLFNLFLKHNPQFLQKGGKVSVLAHSLGTVIMHDILRTTDQKLHFSDPDNEQSPPTPSSASTSELSRQIEQTRTDLVNLELQLIRNAAHESQIASETGIRDQSADEAKSYLSSLRKPANWRSLPQLANLFLIGSPLGLFISLNSLPPSHNRPAVSNISLASSRNSCSLDSHHRATPTTPTSTNYFNFNQESIEAGAMDLGVSDPETLIPFLACRRFYNIFHSYDPIAYRLEPLLLKHYAQVNPSVLPSPVEFLGKSRSRHRKTGTFSLYRDQRFERTNDVSITDDSQSISSHCAEDETIPDELLSVSGESSQGSSSEREESTLKRSLSIVTSNVVYRQHKSRTFKLFSKMVTRRSSHVTNLGPQLQKQFPESEVKGKRLKYRVDYEWQKSFSPLAVLGAHYSYWRSEEVAFFILYRIFGHPDDLETPNKN